MAVNIMGWKQNDVFLGAKTSTCEASTSKFPWQSEMPPQLLLLGRVETPGTGWEEVLFQVAMRWENRGSHILCMEILALDPTQ